MTLVSAPTPIFPVPSPRQLSWHELEFYGFLHFTTNTFTDLEWGFGDESPDIFKPTDFDADSIASLAAEVGMRGLILTCKHHDGFCLWPSGQTEHSVKNSSWRDGKGDVVRELSDACRRHGLRFGVYLSPWDRNHPDYGKPAYLDCYRAQLRELLTNYGPLFEVWHDGANGGDGYYGGARERRTIDKLTYYDWPNTWQIVRELQPDAVIFSDVGPDIRWCGNERGEGNETTWLTLNTDGWCPGFAKPPELNVGHEDGDRWLPPEVDVSIRPGWFYHAREDLSVKTVRQLVNIYYQSVGRSGALLLNLPPDRRGRIHEIDAERLRQFRRIIDATFSTNLAEGAAVSASSTHGNASEFSPGNVLCSCPDTYWAADDGVTAADLVFDLGQPKTFNRVLLQEHLALGQRVRRWAVDVETGTGWEQVAEATTIGHKRILRIPDTTAQKVRIRILDAKACPAIRAAGLYREPVFAADPVITCDIDGNVMIDAGKGVSVRYTVDGSLPTTDSPAYETPISLPSGGLVTAGVLSADNPGVLVPSEAITVRKRIGLAKRSWKILDGPEGCARTIDADSASVWESPAEGNYPYAITIDLGATHQVAGFSYLPKQHARNSAGYVEKYRISITDDPADWGGPVAEGRFDNIANNPIEQIVDLGPVTGRYVRFEALSAADGGKNANIAEISIFA